MKRFTFLAILMVLLFLATSVAYAGGIEPEKIRYFFVSAPPIPVGEIVTVVDINEESGDVQLLWEEKVGGGFVPHAYIFQGVKVTVFGNEPNDRLTFYADPKVDTRITIDHYLDTDEDGIVDMMKARLFRSLTLEEQELLSDAELFKSDLKDSKAVLLTRPLVNSDMMTCKSDQILINGMPAEYGPWGNTYILPEEGAEITIVYPDFQSIFACPEDQQVHAMPGDWVIATEFGIQIQDFGSTPPWDLCTLFESLSPSWQPFLISNQLGQLCGGFHESTSYSAVAVLDRYGFAPSVSYNNNPYIPFVRSHKFGEFPELKGGHWDEVKAVWLEGAFFSVEVTLIEGDYRPTFHLQPRDSYVHGDVPGANWEDQIIFIKKGTDFGAPIDWCGVFMYRVQRAGWNQPLLQRWINDDPACAFDHDVPDGRGG